MPPHIQLNWIKICYRAKCRISRMEVGPSLIFDFVIAGQEIKIAIHVRSYFVSLVNISLHSSLFQFFFRISRQ